jgi:hypothetical protein
MGNCRDDSRQPGQRNYYTIYNLGEKSYSGEVQQEHQVNLGRCPVMQEPYKMELQFLIAERVIVALHCCQLLSINYN